MIEETVLKTIKEYKLFTKNQKVLVAASGGKDSNVLMYILKKNHYNFEAVHIDPGITDFKEKTNLLNFCEKHKIKLTILNFKKEFNATLPEILSKTKRYHSCTICGVLRRHLINRYARTNKFSAVATGHNLNDEAQATLMNIFRDDFDRFLREGVKPGIMNIKEFVPRVKPLYFVREEEILNYAKANNILFHSERCPLSYGVYRDSVKIFMKGYEDKAENIVNFALAFVHKEHNEIKTCRICGEPSNSEICKSCKILLEVKNAGVHG